MIVWYMWETLTEQSVKDGDVDDHGFINADGEYISMAEAWGDSALHLKHQSARMFPLVDEWSVTELADSILEAIGRPDSIDERGDGVIFYGDGSNATIDGEPYISSMSVEGNSLDLDNLVNAVKWRGDH